MWWQVKTYCGLVMQTSGIYFMTQGGGSYYTDNMTPFLSFSNLSAPNAAWRLWCGQLMQFWSLNMYANFLCISHFGMHKYHLKFLLKCVLTHISPREFDSIVPVWSPAPSSSIQVPLDNFDTNSPWVTFQEHCAAYFIDIYILIENTEKISKQAFSILSSVEFYD